MAECGEAKPKLTVPYCPGDEDNAGLEPINTLDLKYVADYSGIGLLRVEELDVLSFFALLHDAVTYNLMQTQSGREYLEKCQRMRQIEPDYAAIRRLKK